MARLLQLMFLGLIHAYRGVISPLFVLAGGRCRHEPSCSAYALDAVRRHGAWLGGWMALARVARCRPGGSAGWDPAPPRADAPWWRPWAAADWRGPRRTFSTESVELDPYAEAHPSRRR